MALSSFGCLRDRETYYAGFSWHSTDARIMKDAGGRFAAARTQGGRTSVDWEGFLPVKNGFFSPGRILPPSTLGTCGLQEKLVVYLQAQRRPRNGSWFRTLSVMRSQSGFAPWHNSTNRKQTRTHQ